jgi:hypothetical protein
MPNISVMRVFMGQLLRCGLGLTISRTGECANLPPRQVKRGGVSRFFDGAHRVAILVRLRVEARVVRLK